MQDEAVQKQITEIITRETVVLFMKGDRRTPQCGFSAQVVQILDDLVPRYETVDVLQSPELRDGIKEFSQWPTIPQLYVAGKFVGGCDIVRELNESGELQQLLGVDSASLVPTITISDGAVRAFADALSDAGGDVLRLGIDARFQHDLYLGPRKAGDIEVTASGVTLLLDRPSARRADGVKIDFVEGNNSGFKIDNPNQPPGVKALRVTDAKAMLDRGELHLFDVRPESESDIARIRGRARWTRRASRS